MVLADCDLASGPLEEMKFVRFGDLGATDYSKPSPSGKPGPYGKGTFHAPPARKGIYAFIHPYTESFLWAWKIEWGEDETEEEAHKKFREYYRTHKHVFEYDGPIWCHLIFDPPAGIVRGSWVLVDSASELETLLQREKHRDIKGLAKYHREFDSDHFGEQIANTKDPYKRGLGGFTSRDHLEVFIEKKHLNKIR